MPAIRELSIQDIDDPEEFARALRLLIMDRFDRHDIEVCADDDDDPDRPIRCNEVSFVAMDSCGGHQYRVTVTDPEAEGTPIRVTRQGDVTEVMEHARKLGTSAATKLLDFARRIGAARALEGLEAIYCGQGRNDWTPPAPAADDADPAAIRFPNRAG